MNRITQGFIMGILMVTISGCAAFKKTDSEIQLQKEIARLQKLLDEKDSAVKEKEGQVSSLELAKEELAKSLEKELGDYKAKLEMTERGLVLTFLAEVFFDSGKAIIKNDAKASLAKVSEVLNKDVPDSPVAVEGHTDNVPIKYSGWKSNWELSTARALAVVHYFVDEGKIAPQRMSANGYGEYRPVASNEDPKTKQQNRRVEIVILPAKVEKVVKKTE